MIRRYKFLMYGGATLLSLFLLFVAFKKYGDTRAELVERVWSEKLVQERLNLAESYMNEIARQQAIQLETEQLYVESKQKTEMELATLHSDYGRLQQYIKSEEQRSRTRFETSGELDGAGADWIGGFAACAAEYIELGEDFARTADKLRGLQDYNERIQKGSNPR